MIHDVLEFFAVWALLGMMLLLNITNFRRAYRSAEKGRKKFFRPALLTVLWAEALLIIGCWEHSGNLLVLPIEGIITVLSVLLPVFLLWCAWYFRYCILQYVREFCGLYLVIFLQSTLLLTNMLSQENYILQSVSIGVIIFLVLWQGGCALMRLRKEKTPSLCWISIASVVLALWFVAGAFAYLNPFDQRVEFKLVAQVELSEPLACPAYWEGAYDEYGLYSGPLMITGWEEKMNLDQYSYIVCYGAKMESLKINMWETNKYPFPRGVYDAEVSFGDESFPSTVFIYQIDKLRVENEGH